MINEVLNKMLYSSEETRGEKWITEMVRLIDREAKPIISKFDYEANKNILFGKFPDTNLDKLFTGEYMGKLRGKLSKDSTLHFFERIRNTLIDERNQSGLTITVNSLDPEKNDKKKQDRALLENRKGIESLLNEITENNGMPPQKVNVDDYHGNVELFDEMGYDEFDPIDLNNFFDSHYGLKQEIILQKPINDVFRANQVTRNYDRYINDILICLCNFSQVYVDQFEGAIKIKHLYPYEVKVLQATESNDFKDAQGFHIHKSTNIQGFLRKFGDRMNIEKDWDLLLSASMGGTAHNFKGIINEAGDTICGEVGNGMDFKRFLDLPIRYTYTEFKTTDRLEEQTIVTNEGNLITQKVTSTTPFVEGVESTVKLREITYTAWALDAGIQNPKVIKHGPLYMGTFEGMNDEYSGFSIKGNKRDGTPVAEILKPFWNIINVTFKMAEMLINDIKPDGHVINYSTSLKVAEWLSTAKDVPNDIKAGFKMYLDMIQDSANIITDTPTTDDNMPVGGGSQGITKRENGLNKTAGEVIKIIDWAEKKASQYVGTEGIELTEPKDGYKLSIENKRRTRAATSFIDFILLNHLEDISITVLNQTQDISKFPDIKPYKYLLSSIGEKAMKFIAGMKKAAHRMGTYLDTFNNDLNLLDIKQSAYQAFANKELAWEQYMFICSIDNPKEASAYMARERQKADKKKQMDQLTLLQQQNKNAAEADDRKYKIEKMKATLKGQDSAKQANGFVLSAQINAKSAFAIQQMKDNGQNKRLADEAMNEIDKIAAQATANAQKSPI